MTTGINKKAAGFTLIEMSMVLTVIALILGAALSIVASRIEEGRVETTQERMKYVMNAIKQFAKANRYLPCPAKGDIVINVTNFGIGGDTAAGAGNCNTYDLRTSATGVIQGVVPTATLGIDPIYMIDGWNRRITYAVDGQLTSSANYPSLAQTSIDIQLLNENSVPLSTRAALMPADDLLTDCSGADVDATGDCIPINPAVIIISHGANGFGAWPLKGTSKVADPLSRSPTSKRSMEDDNTHVDAAMDAEYRYKPIRSTEGASPTTQMSDQIFDDYVMYWTKWELDR